MYWLCGEGQGFSGVPQQKFSRLAQFSGRALPSPTPCLLVFPTPNHKFAILCAGDSADFKAYYLQSNKDRDTGAPIGQENRTHTLQDYLADPPQRMSSKQLLDCFADMQDAVKSTDACEAMFRKHFGIPFK